MLVVLAVFLLNGAAAPADIFSFASVGHVVENARLVHVDVDDAATAVCPQAFSFKMQKYKDNIFISYFTFTYVHITSHVEVEGTLELMNVCTALCIPLHLFYIYEASPYIHKYVLSQLIQTHAQDRQYSIYSKSNLTNPTNQISLTLTQNSHAQLDIPLLLK